MEFQSRYGNLDTKFIWKYHLKIGGHFASASVLRDEFSEWHILFIQSHTQYRELMITSNCLLWACLQFLSHCSEQWLQFVKDVVPYVIYLLSNFSVDVTETCETLLGPIITEHHTLYLIKYARIVLYFACCDHITRNLCDMCIHIFRGYFLVTKAIVPLLIL